MNNANVQIESNLPDIGVSTDNDNPVRRSQVKRMFAKNLFLFPTRLLSAWRHPTPG